MGTKRIHTDPKMKLHLITDGEKSIAELVRVITNVHTAADAIHIREKKKTAGELVVLIEELHQNGVPKSKLIINDRIDAAIMTGVNQVQLPAHSFDVKLVKQHFPELEVGCSIHSAAEAVICEENGADRLLYGHVFQTSSKPGLKARGVQEAWEIAGSVRIPVFVIGGIVPSSISEIRHLKIDGVAVMSYVFSAEDPLQAVLELTKQLKGV
ncbi:MULTISPECIES: thiazole tautomerase TenI [Bacillaceae]|uniref:thiazole tautomerase TenI n=1 Tax=Bacillaceae TaxID=186817 RepID=UPI000C75815B|nr:MULTISPECIES: thiazole tautomerase TenI [Bacillaceae]PLR68983.1 thiamine phosphate synthase [Bacillus sp. UMB0893]